MNNDNHPGNPISFFLKKFPSLKIILLFVVIGLIVYANTFSNQFVGDDNVYIIANPDLHVFNILKFFGQNAFNYAGQYRPLQPTYFGLLYMFFGPEPFFYHVFALLFHTLNGVLVYLLFRKFLSRSLSLILALIFLVHPINNVSVAYIAHTVDSIFFSFGITALLLGIKSSLSKIQVSLIFILLLCSILMKETGILFIFLLLLLRFLLKREKMLFFTLGSSATIAIYFIIRFFVGNVYFSTRQLTPIARLSFLERLSNIPQITFYYLKTFLFPITLGIDQQWTIRSLTLKEFYMPLIIISLSFLLWVLSFLYMKRGKKHLLPQFIFFSFWFAVTLTFHLQLFPLDQTVADHWFYLPIVGLLGILGTVAQSIHVESAFNKLSVLAVIVIISLLSIRTIIRNRDWNDDLTIHFQAIQVDDNYDLEANLGSIYSKRGNYQKALVSLKKSVAMLPYEFNVHDLGAVYQQTGDLKKAKEYYFKAIHTNSYNFFSPHMHGEDTYKSITTILLSEKKFAEAESFTKNALDDYPDSPYIWFFYAIALYKQNKQDTALSAASKAYALLATEENKYIYSHILNKQPISIKTKFGDI